MRKESRLKIALQKSGRLSEQSQILLKQCGLKIAFQKDKLIAHTENMPIDLLLVRDDDIPGLVMDGVVDLGIAGDNVLEEERLKRIAQNGASGFIALRTLEFGACRLSLAVPKDMNYQCIEDLSDMRIATSFPYLLKSYFDRHKVAFKSCFLAGSVEVAPRAGLADAICDLVSTGGTLEANGLKEAEVIYRSKAMLIQAQEPLSSSKQALIDKILARMQGVIQARESKYIMLHALKDRLDEVIKLLPGAERPTILPLAHDDERVAIHVVSTETLFWETMESLKALGASSILVLPIEKMME